MFITQHNLVIKDLLFAAILCFAASGPALAKEYGKSTSSFQLEDLLEGPDQEFVPPSGEQTEPPSPLSPEDSLYRYLLSSNWNYWIESDSAKWRTLCRDFFESYPIPLPGVKACNDTGWSVQIGAGGVPLVRRITHPVHGPLLVTLHTCADNTALSFWEKTETGWKQKGKSKIFTSRSENLFRAAFIGDSAATCLGVADKNRSFSLYRLDPLNPSRIYCDTVPYNDPDEDAYQISFVTGNDAARFGCFGAQSVLSGHGGWERMRFYFWDGKSCRTIPIPGVEDGAIRTNHISDARWLHKEAGLKGADLLIAKRYIDSYSVFPGVYRFDGSSWAHVSAERAGAVTPLIKDDRYQRMFRILYDSSYARSYDSTMADTVAMIETAARFKKKPSHGNIISRMFDIAVHRYAVGDYAGSVQMLRYQRLPYGLGDRSTQLSLYELEALKALFVSMGDLSYVKFADTLFNYARYIHTSPAGSPIAPRAMPQTPPRHPVEAIDSYIRELWPAAIAELEVERARQSGGRKTVALEKLPYDTLQTLVGKVNKSLSASSVGEVLSYFLSRFPIDHAEFLLLAARGMPINRLMSVYADTAVPSLVKRLHTGALPQTIPAAVLLNYCLPRHSGILRQAGLEWDTTDYVGTQSKLAYGLALGDSSALQVMAELLARGDTIAEQIVWKALSPSWAFEPIRPACAFTFETAWTLRPSVETLQRYMQGLIDFMLFAPDSLGVKAMDRAQEIIDSSGDDNARMAMTVLSTLQLTRSLRWTDSLSVDSLMKSIGVSEDTLYSLLLESYSQMMGKQGFDFRSIGPGLSVKWSTLIDWAIKQGVFREYRKLLIPLMLTGDITGYDTLMKPISRYDSTASYRVDELDFSYILRLGSAESRLRLATALAADSTRTAEANLLKLSLTTSRSKRRAILRSLPLFDPDTLGSDHWRHVNWSINDYLMLIRDPALDKEKWRRLFFFRSHSSALAIKDWWYAVMVDEFGGKIREREILGRRDKHHFPLEFACDIMKFKDLDGYIRRALLSPDSDVDLYFSYPAIEQVYAKRLLWEQKKTLVLRFAE